jgi:hypothetical protein
MPVVQPSGDDPNTPADAVEMTVSPASAVTINPIFSLFIYLSSLN